jgi:hypothetical protein
MEIRSVAAGLLAGLVLGGVAWAGGALKTKAATESWREWDRAVGDALQGRGDEEEKGADLCFLMLEVQGNSYRDRLRDWERRLADPDLGISTSPNPPVVPTPDCRVKQ